MFLQKEPIHRSSFAAPSTTAAVARGGRGPAGRFNDRPPTPGPAGPGRTNHGSTADDANFPVRTVWAPPVQHQHQHDATPRAAAVQSHHPLRFRWQCRGVTRTPRTPPGRLLPPPVPRAPPPTLAAHGIGCARAPPPLDTLPRSRSAPPARPRAGGKKNQIHEVGPRCSSRGLAVAVAARPGERRQAGRQAGGVRDFPFASAGLPCSKGKPADA